WITERKDVLYSLFYLGSIVVYIRFVTKSPNKPRLLWYSILLFICSLFSKIEAVTLPLSLLLIDYWMRRPFSMKLIIEKIPYFLLSLFFGLAGIYIIYRVGLAVPDFLKTDSVLTFSERLFFGLYAISGYIIKFFVPYSQSAMYPYPVMTGWTALWIRFINPALLVVVVAAVWWSLRKTRAILFGILFFLVNIFFLLQIIAVGNGFFADRYTYIPYFGLAFITAWFAGEVAKKNPGGKRLVHVVMVAFILTFAVMTFSRCKVWKDGLSLWSDVISRYPGRMMEPYANRGIAYTFNHDWSHAVEDFSEALSVGPVSSGIYADRGIVYGFAGQPEMAVGDFTEAVRLDPKNAKALYNRGVTCVNMGEPGKAMSDFRKVLLLEPANVSACSGLSILYFVQKNYDTCRMMAEKGIHIDPYRPELYSVIGNCELETGDIDKAIGEFRHCLRIDNSSLDASLGLVAAFVVKGDRENAFRNMEIARQTAQEKNIALNITDIENSGVTMGDRKREAIGKVLLQKR
ncbi:MAG: tetratricopeptide repeat protein, partial [Bacteroidota bacterium]